MKQKNFELHSLDLTPGSTIKIKGKVLDDASRFSLNLGRDLEDLALHFTPRFDDGIDGCVIVCNSKCCGSWEAEHRDKNFPFSTGTEVKLTIEFKGDVFTIKLPNGHEVEFPNRHSFEKISYLNVSGDFEVTSIKFD
ncbi:galectin-2 isoform X2 [Latimeria chalumnae]|uniref:galectin-2 isoform X2 n=1 Tax=Latimeria chalumnae TaxID=7897 RepID=UPI0003C1263C|nr:PREDICTED: galectin-2 isoform X2 [Latimeria chalumnae]|eukprot:XP_006010609.1 PREDICTED: galectin-2 isoform X2 [Latimeria chalumnae]